MLLKHPPLKSILLLLALSAAALVTAEEEKPCTIHGDGKYYDLNPLKANKDYTFDTPGGHKFHINVCQPVKTELWELSDPNTGGFVRGDRGDFSVGLSNTTLLMSDGIPKLKMRKGSKCKGSETTLAETVIEFMCDTSVFGQGQPMLRAQLPTDDEPACGFFIEWKTHFACPTGERSGPFGFLASLVVLLVVVVMIYLLLGTLYNRYVLELRGFDQVPRFSIEAMKYHVGHGVDAFREWMTTRGYEGGQRSFSGDFGNRGYERVPGGLEGGFGRPRRSETNPVSHQAGVDVGGGLDGGFVRPNPSSPRPQPPPPPPQDTNPVSHHSQSQSQQQTEQAHQPPSQQNQNQQPPPPPQTQAPAAATQPPFALEDDDEDEEEEDLAAAAPASKPQTPGGGGGAIRL
ncbi:hypothetical protein PQX77_009218 [Marasmius sp. AFHP31]|nr:hypothetical protein PQX77_009218 [Marasmius sp. AFHP31]